MDFWTRLQSLRERWNVLEHPFYLRWSRGELTRAELASYSGQYRHAVVALADASTDAARMADPAERPGLLEHAREERSHVELWDGFVNAIGGDCASAPNPQTSACARSWAGDGRRSLERTLVALYAIESGQPAIAETKARGLREHYGLDTGPATAYFDVHSQLDRRHAAEGRELIDARLSHGGVDRTALLSEAERVLEANWRLLDGVCAGTV